jgi:hypothetical protein
MAIDVVMSCDKCGKEPPIDKEKSNENWIVYRPVKECECGGTFGLRCIEKAKKKKKGAE